MGWVPSGDDGEVGVVAGMDGDVDRGGVTDFGGVAEEKDVDEGDSSGVICWICDIDFGGEDEGVLGSFCDSKGADFRAELLEVMATRQRWIQEKQPSASDMTSLIATIHKLWNTNA